MTKHEKFERHSRDYVREFFVLWDKKSSVPPGCVFAGIRFVAALAGMNNYQTRAAPRGTLRENSNAMDK